MDDVTKVDVKEGNRRLMLLVAKLYTVPAERFNYNLWVGIGWKGTKDLSCGTTACAAAWATTVPELQALGLYLYATQRGRFNSFYGEIALESHPLLRGHAALQTFFGLDYKQAEYLFYPRYEEQDATAIDVAKKIERFVAEREEGRYGVSQEVLEDLGLVEE